MRVAVIGCGSIGRRHIRNLLSLGVEGITCCDMDRERLDRTTGEYGIAGFPVLAEVLAAKPDAVVIGTSTSSHLPLAREAARAGCHLFIEKPLSDRLEGIDGLADEVDEKRLVTMIGSNFKFHPSFTRMKGILDSRILGRVLSARCQFGQYLPDWHPWEDYRKTYSARRELGGGILLDSHEFDYMSWFLGDVEEVFCMAGKLSNLEIDTEDTAEVLLKFHSGAVGEIHLDYTQRHYQRNYEFFGEEGTLKWDFNERTVRLYKAREGMWEVFEEPRNYDFNEMYRNEMKHFLDCAESGEQTLTDLHAGLRTLKAITAAKASAMEGRLKRIEEVG